MNQPQATVHSFQNLAQTLSPLDQLVREGAQRMLQAAIEAEVSTYIEQHQHLRDERGHRLVVRNGHLPERQVLTGAGSLTVKKPRVDDRRREERFTSLILPRYMNRPGFFGDLVS